MIQMNDFGTAKIWKIRFQVTRDQFPLPFYNKFQIFPSQNNIEALQMTKINWGPNWRKLSEENWPERQ